jgi:LemA protein
VIVVWILLGIVVVIGLGLVVSYNRFVSQRNLIKNAFANIDTELRRRYDLIPNLVETVKGYASHEREVFEEVARTRAAAAGTSGQSPAAQVVENYPELKANQNFLALQSELSNTEDRIQASRRFYNANVQDYNRRIQSFPSVFVARAFHFKEEEFFEIPDAERAAVATAPQVDFGTRGGDAPAAPSAPPADPTPSPATPAPPEGSIPPAPPPGT